MRNFEPVAAVLMITGAFALAVACGSPTDGTCDETSSCPGGPPDGGGAESGADVVPAGCDPSAEPKDAPKCVVSDFGVFVDGASGSDANAGTKESPVKSIGAALGKLGGKTRVYVCEGTYAEHVKLTSAVSLHGGFACGAWTYNGNKPKVAPADAGYALEVAGTTSDVVVSDLSFVARDAVDAGQSSVGVFVQNASKVLLLRNQVEAGAGKDGADGEAGTTGTITAVTGGGAVNASGYPASGTTAGPIKTCTCSSGGTSSGAAGGGPMGAGALGAPNLGGNAPNDGAGGLASTSCAAAEPNGSGNLGADATSASDATKVSTLGALDLKGWNPQAGIAGSNGTSGQGGGGGGGRDGTSAGGGGGCGGCGGTGGKGGGGGGASIAVVSLQSTVALRASTLVTRAAGRGGVGGAKGIAMDGGAGASGGPTGCGGGDGGRGGDGGSGSGGAGGVSAAVLYKGPKPVNEGSTLTPGARGAKGVGGTPNMNDGPEGESAEMVAAP